MSGDPRLNDQMPPNDKTAEASLLGSVLRDNSTLLDASQEAGADDFYSYGNGQIWRAMLDLAADGKPIDPVTLHDELEKRKKSGDTGGAAFIVELWNTAPSTANAVYYAKIVREKARLRSVIQAGQAMQRRAFDAGVSADDIVSDAADAILALSLDAKTKTVDWQAALNESLETIDRRAGKAKGGETESALLTGWRKLDMLTGGLHKRELVVISARPSVGKTLAALKITDSVAADGGLVYFASLEQGRVELVHRVLSKRSGLNSYKFRIGQFGDEDGERLLRAADDIKNHKVWINDAAGQTLSSVLAESRRIKIKHGLDMVVVDYLGLMDGDRDRRAATRNEEIGRLTRGLKRLAKDLDVVVVTLAQLNRGSENRPNKTPRLADLRDSGEIEQDADTVFMLHKPEEKDANRDVDELEWLVEKQRNGPCGKIMMQHFRRTFDIRESGLVI